MLILSIILGLLFFAVGWWLRSLEIEFKAQQARLQALRRNADTAAEDLRKLSNTVTGLQQQCEALRNAQRAANELKKPEPRRLSSVRELRTVLATGEEGAE